jgi:chromate transport protein ChrA
MFTPSPVGTLLSSAAFVTFVAIVVLALWHKPTPSATTSLTERLLGRIERSVRNFVYYATYAFGTHYRSGWIRKPWVVAVLSAIAVAGSLLPWPTCIVVISLGLLGVFVTFLHWSQIPKNDSD